MELRKLPPNKYPGTSALSEVNGEAPGHIHVTEEGHVKYNVKDEGDDEAIYQDVTDEQSGATCTGAVSLDGAARSVDLRSANASNTSNANNPDDIGSYYDDIK